MLCDKFLLEEIIFEILLRLPAHVLYQVMRYVCRQWRMIIEGPHFVSTYSHSQLAANSTLLMHFPKYPETHLYQLFDVTESHHANYSGCEFLIPSKFPIYTCNGLVLFQEGSKSNSKLYVGNPITHRLLTLPLLSNLLAIECYGIAFETCSKVYKVAVVYYTLREFELACAILTVGIDDAWRSLNCAHLTEDDMRLLTREPPITSTNFIYWDGCYRPYKLDYMLALDLKSETMKRISLPSFPSIPVPALKYLAKGNSISVWYPKPDCSMEVWVLKDNGSDEWVKYLCIDGRPIRNEVGKVMSRDELARSRCFRYITPRSWLGNGEKILFHGAFDTCSILFVYDLKTGGCCPFDVKYHEPLSPLLVPFVNSLTWIS